MSNKFQILVKSKKSPQELRDLILSALEGSRVERGYVVFGKNIIGIKKNSLFGEPFSLSDLIAWGEFEYEITSFILSDEGGECTRSCIDAITSKLQTLGFKYELLVSES